MVTTELYSKGDGAVNKVSSTC